MLSHHRIYSRDPLFVCLSGLNWSCHGVSGRHPWPRIPFNADPSFLSQSSIVLWHVSPGIVPGRLFLCMFSLLCDDGVHIAAAGERLYYRSIRGAVIYLSKSVWGCSIPMSTVSCHLHLTHPVCIILYCIYFSIIVGYGEYGSHSHLHLAVCWLLHIWFLVLPSRFLVIWRMCASTHSRLDMASSDLLCNLDISFRISHDILYSRFNTYFSLHMPLPVWIQGSTCVYPFHFLCLRLPIFHNVHILLQLSSVSVMHACVCPFIHSLWCGGLFWVAQTLV